jgi:CubicO group peptidase (beta-lactamase class C family)
VALGLMMATSSIAAQPDLDAALRRWSRGALPGGTAVAYVDADGVQFAATGKFAPDDSRAIGPDTQFEIGSVTKVFTSILLAESERAGRVRRDDPAAKFLLPAGDPDTAKLDKITLLALATHSSGLPRMPPNQPEAAGPNPYANYDRVRLVEALRQVGPAAPTGRATVYSNFGGAVLGEALAAAWGEPYADVLTARVLKPLDLDRTWLDITGSKPADEFAPGFAGDKRVEHWTFQAMAPAGALVSSTRDLAKFVEACLGLRETPLRAALDETFRPQRAMDSPPGQIGLGWLIAGEGERRVWWHNGATGGFRSFVGFCPATRTGVVVLTSNTANNPDALGMELLGAKPKAPVPVATENAGDYTGSFSLTPEFSVVIAESRGALSFQATAEPRYAMRRKEGDWFTLVDSTVEVSFERDSSGRVVALVLHQNGRDIRAPRTAELDLAPEKLAEYVGRFSLTPRAIMTMTVENGRLMTQLTGQPKFPLFASAPDRFFLKVVNAQLRFERDDHGAIVAVVLHQNGRDQRAEKTP